MLGLRWRHSAGFFNKGPNCVSHTLMNKQEDLPPYKSQQRGREKAGRRWERMTRIKRDFFFTWASLIVLALLRCACLEEMMIV